MSRLAVPMLVLIALAGCAGAASPDAAEDAGADAQASDGGALRGFVASDELLPIEGATVALENGRGETTTDAAGRFEFGGLDPGAILVDVTASGFEAETVEATVLLDEPVEIRIVLRASAVPVPHVESLIFNGYIRVGNAVVDASFLSLGQPGGCEKCLFPVDAKADLASFQLEALFSASVAKPHGPLQLGWQVWNRTKAELATDISGVYGGGYLKSGGKGVVHHHVKDTYGRWNLAGEGLMLIHTCDSTWVCVEQRYQTFVSLAYLEPIDPAYTALPDS